MNTLKKDIVVKNSVKPRTYIDYETGRLFYETSLLVEGGLVNGWFINLPDEVYQKIIKYYYQKNVLWQPHPCSWASGRREITLRRQLNLIRSKFMNAHYGVPYCGCMTKKGTECKSPYNLNSGVISLVKRNDRHWRKEKDLVLDENELRELSTIKSIFQGFREEHTWINMRLNCCGKHDLHRWKHKGSGVGLDKYLEWNGIKFRNGYVCRTDKKLTY